MIDIELGQRFVTGGEDELEELINLYGKKLLRYATTILCDYQEAEDIVQEVFISAYKNRKTFDGTNLSAWLYKIAYNYSLNRLKKRKLIFFDKVPDKAVYHENGAGLSDETLFALRRLKPKERALIYGRIMEEQSYEQLSALLGISESTLRKQYERAKKKLASYITASKYGKEQKHE